MEATDKLSFLWENDGVRVCLNGVKVKAKFFYDPMGRNFKVTNGATHTKWAEEFSIDTQKLVDALWRCYDEGGDAGVLPGI